MIASHPRTVVVLGLGLFSCFSARPWRGADDFVGGLRCGITRIELSTYAARFPRLQIHEPLDYKGMVLALRGNTKIRHWFEDDKLRAYRVTWNDGVMSVAYQQKHDLCTGVKSVELHVISSSPLQEGATVWLDGERVGELSRAGNKQLDVPLGTHTLRVEKSGFGTWSAQLRYDNSSSGYDRLLIPENAREPA